MLQEAVQLVRSKYLEEQEGRTDTPTATRYNQACQDFPVTMNSAQAVWNRSLESD